jgi:hypothetical protein
MAVQRLCPILLLVIIEAVSLSLISCSQGSKPENSKSKEEIAVEEARTLIDMNDGLAAISVLEKVRLNAKSDTYYVTLASAHASVAKILPKDFVSVAKLAVARIKETESARQ